MVLQCQHKDDLETRRHSCLHERVERVVSTAEIVFDLCLQQECWDCLAYHMQCDAHCLKEVYRLIVVFEMALNGKQCKVEVDHHFDQSQTTLAVLIELYFLMVAVVVASGNMEHFDMAVDGSSAGADLPVMLCYPL